MALLYEMSVPVFVRGLENLTRVLKAGEKWADENDVPHSRLVDATIAPDMRPLPFQVQFASNAAKHSITRITGKEKPALEDNETTFAQFYDRIQKTIDILKTTTPEDFQGKEEKEISMFEGKFTMTGLSYLQFYGVPNFFFHLTTAYAILRKEGVPVGKLDFLGAPSRFKITPVGKLDSQSTP